VVLNFLKKLLFVFAVMRSLSILHLSSKIDIVKNFFYSIQDSDFIQNYAHAHFINKSFDLMKQLRETRILHPSRNAEVFLFMFFHIIVGF